MPIFADFKPYFPHINHRGSISISSTALYQSVSLLPTESAYFTPPPKLPGEFESDKFYFLLNAVGKHNIYKYIQCTQSHWDVANLTVAH